MKNVSLTWCGICLSFFLYAQKDTLHFKDKASLRGYVKNMQIASFTDGLDEIISDNLIHNRINLRYEVNEQIRLGLEFRNRLFWGETVDATNYAQLVDTDEGIVDMSFTLVNQPSLVLLMQIDRAWVHWSKDLWEIRLGRQRINWGTNLFWNANDLFNVYSLVDFDYEERPGTDALSIQKYFRNRHAIELAIQPGETIQESVGAIRFQFNKWRYDYQLIAGTWYRDYVLGFGWAGNIKNTGFKGECSYFRSHAGEESSLSASFSLDYMFANQLFVTSGLLINSGGINAPLTQAENLFLNPLSAKNLMPNKFSAIINAGFPISPILSANLTGVYAPGVNSLLCMPSLLYFMTDVIELSVFLQSFWAKINTTQNIGNGVFMRFRYSF